MTETHEGKREKSIQLGLFSDDITSSSRICHFFRKRNLLTRSHAVAKPTNTHFGVTTTGNIMRKMAELVILLTHGGLIFLCCKAILSAGTGKRVHLDPRASVANKLQHNRRAWGTRRRSSRQICKQGRTEAAVVQKGPGLGN